jgi:hypothetical protein
MASTVNRTLKAIQQEEARMKNRSILSVILAVLVPGAAVCKVQDSASTGFTIKQTYNVGAAPDEVYRRFVRVGEWWNSAHTFSGDAHNLSIEEKAMGCWCEKLPGGGAVRHMQVVNFAPGRLLRFTGGLGPLQAMAATGAFTVQFTAAEGGTRVDVTYAVTGYSPAGLNTLAPVVDSVFTEQLTRFKNYVEHDNPAPEK